MRQNQKLPNYLRAYRKKCGFTQEELARLAQLSGKAELCELERFHREPSYRTARACAKALGVPAPRLFAGIEASTERETVRRMRELRRRLAAKTGVAGCLQRRIAQKLHWLGERVGELVPNLSMS